MYKILTLYGTRPQLIKAAAISRAFKNLYPNGINEILVDSGQHYDENMSEVFYRELNMKSPDYNLKSKAGSHAQQTAGIMQGFEEVVIKEKPSSVIVFGDTTTTIAGALVASKEKVPVIHIEAGLRSYNKSMPEEINRVVTDHLSTLLFTPTVRGIINLKNEGIRGENENKCEPDTPCIHLTGDVMLDSLLYFSSQNLLNESFLNKYNLGKENYLVVTLHRQSNTNDEKKLKLFVRLIEQISLEFNIDIIFPVHPRIWKFINLNFKSSDNFQIIPAVSYLEMLSLVKYSKLILTDSGGLQKEAYFLQKPSLILRNETEWQELTDNGYAILTGLDRDKIFSGIDHFNRSRLNFNKDLYGDGKAAELIVKIIYTFLSEKKKEKIKV